MNAPELGKSWSLTAPYFHADWRTRDIDILHDTGHTGVVFCLREQHLASPDQLPAMADVVAHAKQLGMTTELDLWSFGRVFGGEALTTYGPDNPACYESGSFTSLVRRGIDAAAELGIDGMFWDEAHFKDCTDCEKTNELPLIEDGARYAYEQHGLENYVCLTSNPLNMGRLAILAAHNFIHRVETDPYFTNYPPDQPTLDVYVGKYSQTVADIAKAHGIRSRIWVQGFQLESGWEDIPLRAAATATSHGIHEIGFWACKNWHKANISVPVETIRPVNNDTVFHQAVAMRALLQS